jgi:hypothetical protein
MDEDASDSPDPLLGLRPRVTRKFQDISLDGPPESFLPTTPPQSVEGLGETGAEDEQLELSSGSGLGTGFSVAQGPPGTREATRGTAAAADRSLATSVSCSSLRETGSRYVRAPRAPPNPAPADSVFHEAITSGMAHILWCAFLTHSQCRRQVLDTQSWNSRCSPFQREWQQL